MSNIINFKTYKKTSALLEEMLKYDLDEIAIIGKKKEDIVFAHTSFGSRTNFIGALESIKLWVWTKYAIAEELDELNKSKEE